MAGTALECRFYATGRSFYKTSVSKMLDMFPYQNGTLEELSFLGAGNKLHLPSSVLHLANRFTIGEHGLDLDSIKLGIQRF